MKQEQFIRIRVKLMEQLRQGAEWSDEEILERIDLLVSETARENRLTVKQREEIRRELFYSVRKLDILQELLDDDRVTEIMVNGYQNIFVEREGKKSRWEKSFVSKEKLEDIKARNTGHDGSLGTAHANSTGDMISRVETMVLMGMELPLEAVRRQIASGVELLVHLERARDGKRQVAEIAEILGYEDGEVRMHGLYRREKDQLKKIGELQHREKLERCFGEAEL